MILRPHCQRGFSLVELLVGSALGLILLAGILSIYLSAKQTYRRWRRSSPTRPSAPARRTRRTAPGVPATDTVPTRSPRPARMRQQVEQRLEEAADDDEPLATVGDEMALDHPVRAAHANDAQERSGHDAQEDRAHGYNFPLQAASGDDRADHGPQRDVGRGGRRRPPSRRSPVVNPRATTTPCHSGATFATHCTTSGQLRQRDRRRRRRGTAG